MDGKAVLPPDPPRQELLLLPALSSPGLLQESEDRKGKVRKSKKCFLHFAQVCCGVKGTGGGEDKEQSQRFSTGVSQVRNGNILTRNSGMALAYSYQEMSDARAKQ